MPAPVKRRRRPLTTGELRDLLELVKLRLALALDVQDVVANRDQIFALSAKIAALRQQLARRERRREQQQKNKEKKL